MNAINPLSIGISQLAYRLPSKRYSLRSLALKKIITSDVKTLKNFGFSGAYIYNEDVLESELLEVGRQLLKNPSVNKQDINWLLLYNGLPTQKHISSDQNSVLPLFLYPAWHINQELQLNNARTLSLSQQGCSGLLSAIHIACSLLEAPGPSSVMCIAGDQLPVHSNREVIYNIMSDGVGAVLVDRKSTKNYIVAHKQLQQSYYWDTPIREDELLAAYFPMAQRTIQGVLEQANLSIDQIRWVIPHNVSLRSWEILAQMLELPIDRVWTDNIFRIGHTVSSDHIINLVDMEQQGLLNKGDYLLLFTFGFGATWSSMILQH